MNKAKSSNRELLLKAALQKIPCDLTIENIQLINVITGEIYPAEVDVFDGIIVRVRSPKEPLTLASLETFNGQQGFLLPGFIDSHMHVESSMMVPLHLSQAIVPWGTTAICSDPHEIANVMGHKGVKFMLDNASLSSLRQYVLAPSCVPSVPGLESSGADFFAEYIAQILDMEGVIGIAELMDFVNIIEHEARMRDILEVGIERNTFLQGHAPRLTGKALAAYRRAGPESDHESTTAIEVNEKLRNGFHVNMRVNSFVDNLDDLLEGVKDHQWLDFVSFCTDDVHAADLYQYGHINRVVATAIRAGMKPLVAIKLATINAAREFGFKDLGAIAPGYQADFQIVENLSFEKAPMSVFVGGQQVAKNGLYLRTNEQTTRVSFPNTVSIPQIESPKDFWLKAPEDLPRFEVAALKPSPGGFLNEINWIELPVKNGHISIQDRCDLCFCAVVNRYGNRKTTVSVLENPQLKKGAYGSTVAHDSHNLVILYKDAEDAYLVAKTLEKTGGGICVVEDKKVKGLLELPAAGLMSPLPVKELSEQIEVTEQAVRTVCDKKTSLLYAALFSLACLPGVVVTDYGIVDGAKQIIIEPFREVAQPHQDLSS